MMVVRLGELYAATAMATVRSRRSLDCLSSLVYRGSNNSAGRPSGCCLVRIGGGPGSSSDA
eukprot:1957202-Prymnesium_polylepis.1